MTWDEITKETGIPSSTARLIYKQAKDKLKKELRYV
jgi:DNA-directed RNA polymerase specialized sigma24 family protein